MNQEFIGQLASALGTARNEMLEKDVLLQQLLLDLSEDGFFSKNLAFKGGTCLIKCYIGYYRFSEDIDFTWIDQSGFKGLSQKAVRERLSGHATKICRIFEEICARRGLDFKPKKGDKRYVEIGGSNKMLTLKLWYNSVVLKRESFIKVQINFVETLCFGTKTVIATGIKADKERSRELSVLFPEYVEYSRGAGLKAYDIKEILSEKVRAILTRRGTKARDFIDIYMIWKRFDIMPEEINGCTKKKIGAALAIYDKYRSNFKVNAERIRTEGIDIGKEDYLLLSDLDNTEFAGFVNTLAKYLIGLSKEIDASVSRSN